jgi:hypothetical protein
MKHPYNILIENISKYSKVLKAEDISQLRANVFQVTDKEFDKLAFFKDVEKETGIPAVEHEYIGASCSNKELCFKPYTVYGFDNVQFYFVNKHY